MRLLASVVLALGIAASPLAQEVYTPGDGVSLPTVVKQVRAYYTEAARNAQIEGTVSMEAVVLTDGKVGDVSVTKSLDEGLDRQAVVALKQWEFKPGLKDGKPVAVRIPVVTRFTLK